MRMHSLVKIHDFQEYGSCVLQIMLQRLACGASAALALILNFQGVLGMLAPDGVAVQVTDCCSSARLGLACGCSVGCAVHACTAASSCGLSMISRRCGSCVLQTAILQRFACCANASPSRV
jgi:hypothetical protein